MSPLSKSVFSTARLAADQRLPAWRESIATLFDITPHGNTDLEGFHASLTSYLLNDQVMFCLCDTTAQRFERGALRVAGDKLDHYLIQTHLSGSQMLKRGSREAVSGPGDLLVIDLAEKHEAVTTDFSHLTLVVPRHLLAPHLKDPDSQQGRVLRADQPLASLAVNHLNTMLRYVDGLSPAQAAHVVEPTLRLMAGALNGSADSVEGAAAGASLTLLTRAKLAIENKLHCNIQVDALCRELNFSRATLYRLFEPYGGVRAYMQERRLRRCAQALLSPADRCKRIYEIAHGWGFASEAHFSRAFKLKFGITPREAREFRYALSSGGSVPEEAGDRLYERWLSETLRA